MSSYRKIAADINDLHNQKYLRIFLKAIHINPSPVLSRTVISSHVYLRRALPDRILGSRDKFCAVLSPHMTTNILVVCFYFGLFRSLNCSLCILHIIQGIPAVCIISKGDDSTHTGIYCFRM